MPMSPQKITDLQTATKEWPGLLARLFLGYHLTFDKLNAVDTMERVAAGQLTEPEFVDWI